MANPILGQILGSVLGGRGGGMGGMGGMASGGLGSVLGSVLGGGAMGAGAGGPLGARRGNVGLGGMGGGRGALLAMLLPLAMQWVQRQGGVGNVLQRAGQRGYGSQANSWLGTGANEPLPASAVQELVGHEDLARMSSQLGVDQGEVADGFAEILPEMVDHLSPDGQLPADADQRLDAGQSALDGLLANYR
jgi:uncharacterized protein YidB (DUF937 family)